MKEQGVTFAIIIVKKSAMQTTSDAAKTREAFRGILDFRDLPVVLASQDSRGVFEYQGRRDLVDFLAKIDPARIPWKEYTVSD